ncbi:MAG: transglycosylase domain-containing protein [Bacteroidales bacterium]|jgi:penicillin-binding protein 1A|nr:transglycosylase domain-containing protein [Bacteroidales bacterium]MDD4058305.1 transglycosylase domain-containing protein [Bacteroidales bacterium]
MEIKNRQKFLKWFRIIVFTPFLLLLIVLLAVGVFADIPSFSELEDPKSNLATEIISEEGEILTTFHIENRSYVTYDELSPNLVAAAIATEDARFMSHSGIDFKSLARVAVKSIILGQTRSGGGGSTITQQLAKTLFPRDTVKSNIPGARYVVLGVNKFREWITSVKLERNYTKNEILSMYMNAVFFGSNAYGIRAASNTFFAKHPSELTIEESALLVGMVNKPTRFNPVINPDLSLQRRNHVLNQMRKYGFIERAVYDSVVQVPVTLAYSQQDHNSGLAPYFRDMLRRVMNSKEPKRSDYRYSEDYAADSTLWRNDPFYGWLNKNLKPDGTKYNLDKDGLKIYTTINAKMQRYAEEAIVEHLGKDLQPAFYRDLRWKNNKPFSNDVPKEVTNNIMKQARRWSDRWRMLKQDGLSDSEIEKSFDKPAKMRVFTWKSPGHIDTIMTPNDSIRHYKSFLRASFMAMEPQTGFVRAYVGGPDYRYFKYDNARQAKRQVGSTIKPFLYTLAMQEGYTPCDKVVNVPQTFIVGDTTWTPESTDKPEWIGKHVTLKWGLTRSSNNISAYLMKQFGPFAMVDMAHRLGIKTHLDPVVSLCLGPADITLYEMVGAYNTFPSRGVHVEPTFVLRIEDKAGNVLGNFTGRKREAISESTAYLMVNLMQGVVNEGTAGRLRYKYIPNGPIAGKTGTTNDQSDGWFIGYVPKLTAGVWVGAEDRQVHFESLALGGGSNMALPIWGIFMQKVLKDGTLGITEYDTFLSPAGFSAEFNCSGADDELEGSSATNDPFFH